MNPAGTDKIFNSLLNVSSIFSNPEDHRPATGANPDNRDQKEWVLCSIFVTSPPVRNGTETSRLFLPRSKWPLQHTTGPRSRKVSAKEKAEIKVKLKLMSTLFRINSNFCLAFRNGVRRLKLERDGLGWVAWPHQRGVPPSQRTVAHTELMCPFGLRRRRRRRRRWWVMGFFYVSHRWGENVVKFMNLMSCGC